MIKSRRIRRELIATNRIFDEAERKEILDAVHEAEELRERLKEAVELIKQWHNMDTAGILTKQEHERMWEIYRELSPEMRLINAALKGETS